MALQWSERALHVFGLASLVVAEPILNRLGERPAFIVDLGIRRPAIFLLLSLVSLGLPAAIVAVEWLILRLFGRHAPHAWHAVTIYVLLSLGALPVIKRLTFLSPLGVMGAALLAAAIAAWSYFKFAPVRAVVSLCAMSIFVVPVVFLLSQTARSILFPAQTAKPRHWNPVPVVVLVFDELCGASLTNDDRQIDADRFPSLAALSRQSTWFRNATTVHVDTEQAVPAILSGKYPRTNLAPTSIDLPQNLFSVLDTSAGYQMAAFEPVTSLAPVRRVPADDVAQPGVWQQVTVLLDPLARVYLHHVAPYDSYVYLPRIPNLWFGMRDTRRVERTKRRGVFRYGWTDRRDIQIEHFLKCLDNAPEPTLYFMHLLLPHIPWSYTPSGRHYTEDFDKRDLMDFNAHSGLLDFWTHDEWLVVQSQQRYLLQLEYLDRQLGRIIRRMQEAGLFNRCLLIVTADHGVSFRINQPRRHVADGNLGDIASIPMFVKLPFQKQGEVCDRSVESVDILPTIADVLGIALSDPTDGWSMFDAARPERRSTTLFQQDLPPMSISREAVATSEVPALVKKRFGNGDDPAAMFRIGPIPELVGRRVDSLSQSDQPPVEIKLIRFGDTVRDETAEISPCFFEGRILRVPADGRGDQPQVLAVAINGTIQAVTRTYLLDGFRDRWAALAPESSFHSGQNDVRFYSVTGTAPVWKLIPCVTKAAAK
ncbi:MAG TPA: sulfatase-like hydrolase/transferase [Planctomycetaceae bacterium]|jgi:hypothetical protein